MEPRTRNIVVGVAVALVVLVAAGLLVALLGGLAVRGMGPGMMGDWRWGGLPWVPRWGMMLGGGLMMLVFWLVVIGGVVWLIVSLAQRSPSAGGGPEESPLEILKRRYARGEISREEYEAMRRDLER